MNGTVLKLEEVSPVGFWSRTTSFFVSPNWTTSFWKALFAVLKSRHRFEALRSNKAGICTDFHQFLDRSHQQFDFYEKHLCVSIHERGTETLSWTAQRK